MLAICGTVLTCNAVSAKATEPNLLSDEPLELQPGGQRDGQQKVPGSQPPKMIFRLFGDPDETASIPKRALTDKRKRELARKDNEKARYVYHHAWWMIRETFYDKEFIRTKWAALEHKFDKELSTDNLKVNLQRLARSTMDPFTSVASSKDQSKHVWGHEYGIGTNLDVRRDIKLIPVKGSPADLACIPAGAILKTINGQPVDRAETARKMLRGPIRSIVRVGFKYGDELQEVLIRRTFKEVRAVREFRLLPENVVYIRLCTFRVKGCAREIEACLKRYPNCRAVVLDLRNNGGGYLQEAVEVTRLFVERGAFTAEKQKRRLVISVNGIRSPYKKLPVIFAMNKYSASASELVAGCLRDLSNAQIIGERSFGKGVGQYDRLINKDWRLAVTTFRLKLPSGECVHFKGLQPTITADEKPQGVDDDEDKEWLNKHLQRVADSTSDQAEPELGCVGKESCAAITIRRSYNDRANGSLAAELRLAYAKLGIPTDAEGIELPEVGLFDRF
jgi:Periplasmic protease